MSFREAGTAHLADGVAVGVARPRVVETPTSGDLRIEPGRHGVVGSRPSHGRTDAIKTESGQKLDMEELILRVFQGRATETDNRRLQAWLEAGSENRAYLEELRRIWRMAECSSPSVRSVRHPSAEELLQHAAEATPVPTARAPKVQSPRHGWWLAPLAAAASLAAMALGVSLWWGSQVEPTPFFGVAEFATGPRETVTVRLGDGTIVRLQPSTSLQMDGTDGVRNVWLSGEAFFAVAHDERAPFTVRTRSGTATVLGTRFDVRARDQEMRLVVVDGRVRVEEAGGQYSEEVGPSEMSRVMGDGRVYVSQVRDVFALLDWMQDAMVLQATPLERVVEELAYRYKIPVKMVDPGVASRTITAWFTDEPLEEAVSVICRVADVRCEVSEAGVRIGL